MTYTSSIVSMLFLIITSIAQPSSAYAQVSSETEAHELTSKEKKELKKALKRSQRRILSSPELSFQFSEILQNCTDNEDPTCQAKLEEALKDVTSNIPSTEIKGTTFGICKPDQSNRKLHQLVFNKRSYDCKLSSQGKVYNKNLIRKTYGPGLYWDKMALVMFCTGPAYGTKMSGYTASVGAYAGITVGTVFGRAGACIVVGAGAAVGAIIGGDVFQFEK